MSIDWLHINDPYDVCIVGAGMAGLCASIAAAEQGAKVLLIEAFASLGGQLPKSRGILNAFDPRRQYEMGLSDSPETHLRDLLKFGNFQNQNDTARRLCYEAYGAVIWLEAHGVRFESKLKAGFGSSVPRGHVPQNDSTGRGYADALAAALESTEVTVVREATLTDWSEPDVQGFRTVRITRTGGAPDSSSSAAICLRTRTLVLTAGGFSGNRIKLEAMAPFLKNAAMPNTAATGVVLDLAVNKGAGTVGESFVLSVLCAVDHRGRLRSIEELPAALRNPARFLLVNRKGERFVREDASTELLRLAVHQQQDAAAYVIAPADPFASSTTSGSGSRFDRTSCVVHADSLSSLAVKFSLASDAFDSAIERYESGAKSRRDAFGRDPSILYSMRAAANRSGGWIGCRVAAAVMATGGGLVVGPSGEILDRKGQLMPGIYAAGEIMGGLHGTTPIEGNLLTAAAVFGISAGRAAAFSIRRQSV